MYAGIGYFTLPLLVHVGATHLHACELNPDSIEAMRKVPALVPALAAIVPRRCRLIPALREGVGGEQRRRALHGPPR
jgi:hypothetical protein